VPPLSWHGKEQGDDMRCGLLSMVAALAACSGAGRAPGSEEGRCYPNATCNEGLTCLSNTCVVLSAADGGTEGLTRLDGRAPAPDLAPPPPLVWSACDTSSWPSGYPKPATGVECTTIDIPVDHAKPAGKAMSLRVARHTSKAFPTGKAVFQLAGGPGGTSVGQSGIIPVYIPKLRDSFDLVYVDQRGTGGSGYLSCAAGYPQTKQEWESCAAEHAGKDLQHYLSVDAAHDLEWVRKRLGYGKIYLRAGSYGTRLALEMIRQHESSLAAVVLDGLATPDWDFFSDTVKKMDRGVERLIADCAAAAGCKAIAPDLAGDLIKRRQTLKASPRKILVDGMAYLEDEGSFLLDLKSFVEDSYWRFRVPRAVHEAVAGNNKLWNALMTEVWGATITDGASDPTHWQRARPLRLGATPRPRHDTRGISYVAPGLYMTVICAEDLPNAPGLAALKALGASQTWGASTSGDIIGIAEGCAGWPLTPVDAALRKPVQSSVKTLLLSGEIDYITPAEAAEHAAKTLPQSTHLVVPQATHSTMLVPCVGGIIAAFLGAEGNMSAVDTSCLKSLPAPTW
jgi:pimeloyl-ACP methyl ester carboxylesterase